MNQGTTERRTSENFYTRIFFFCPRIPQHGHGLGLCAAAPAQALPSPADLGRAVIPLFLPGHWAQGQVPTHVALSAGLCGAGPHGRGRISERDGEGALQDGNCFGGIGRKTRSIYLLFKFIFSPTQLKYLKEQTCWEL